MTTHLMESFDPKRFAQTFAHHRANVNGIRLHYVIGGQGDPVVLLHGWPTTWYEWRHVMSILGDRYTVIAPDLRGLGDSSRPTIGYDKRTIAGDIYELVQQLGFNQIHLVGHDLCGQVAYAYVRHSTIEQCGHWLPTERPDQLAQQLLNFFSEE